MRVVFLGTPEFAVPSLRAVLNSPYEVCAVFTQPDRPAGRGQKSQPSSVKQCAQSHGVPVHQPEKIKAEENRPVFERYQPDFIVVVAFGQILPGWMLRCARVAPVNVHASLLPKYRGAAPVTWALLNGDAMTGVTTMLMDEHLDTGPMLLRREVAIPEMMTAGELASQLSMVGADLLIPTLDGLRLGTLQPAAQDDSLATWAPRIDKEMAAISWKRNAREIHNQIRAFNPWPLAFTSFLDRRVQILRSIPESGVVDAALVPGTYLGPTEVGIRVKCGGGTVLEVLEVKLEGKSRITGREFASGARLQPGAALFPNDELR
jgi:methionyl-tRNA formyltransferase